jgi:hypothetical protein
MNGSPAEKGRRGKAVVDVNENVNSVNGIPNAMQEGLQLQNLLERGPNQASMMMAMLLTLTLTISPSPATLTVPVRVT